MKAFAGIDNGVSGTIGIIFPDKTEFYETPVRLEQSYTKKKQNISRIIVKDLIYILDIEDFDLMVLIERPMINGKRFKASMSAARALEATLNVLEMLEIPYQYIDSKEWQRELLPSGIKGSELLKKASLDIGCRLFPQHKELIQKHKDADGILMAEYCRRKF